MPHVIQCKDCGESRTSIYRNTKYCMSCRTLRDLEWLEPEEKRCRADNCKAAFLPVSRKDLYCGKHAGLMCSERGACAFCKQVDQPLHRGMKVCASCIRDVGARPLVLSGLNNGRRDRRKINANALQQAAQRRDDLDNLEL